MNRVQPVFPQRKSLETRTYLRSKQRTDVESAVTSRETPLWLGLIHFSLSSPTPPFTSLYASSRLYNRFVGLVFVRIRFSRLCGPCVCTDWPTIYVQSISNAFANGCCSGAKTSRIENQINFMNFPILFFPFPAREKYVSKSLSLFPLLNNPFSWNFSSSKNIPILITDLDLDCWSRSLILISDH